MNILVLDTTTERLIVARQDSDGRRSFVNLASGGNHALEIVPRVAELMGNTVPDRLGVSVGPGSFTGVRIGLATAKGLAEGWRIPLYGLDNLAAMAQTARKLCPDSDSAIFPVIDARKKKYYGSLHSGARQKQSHVLVEPGDFSVTEWFRRIELVWHGPVVVSGFQASTWAAEAEVLPDGWEVLPLQDWSTALLEQLEGSTEMTIEAGPRYLRLSEAEELRRDRSTG